MNTDQRRIRIYELTKTKGEVFVNDLASFLGVSTMTIRRDLDFLEESGLIQRKYGKAILIDDTKKEAPFASRYQSNQSQKQQIAAMALQHFGNVSTLYIDGSSTAYEFIRALPLGRRLTVFTNSVAVLQYLRECSDINTFVMGGMLAQNRSTLDSEITANIARDIYVDAAVISCSGFSTKGFFNNGITGSQVKKIMLENSQHNFLLADYSKYNSQGVFLLNTWDIVDTLVCDRAINAKDAHIISSYGVEIITE